MKYFIDLHNFNFFFNINKKLKLLINDTHLLYIAINGE